MGSSRGASRPPAADCRCRLILAAGLCGAALAAAPLQAQPSSNLSHWLAARAAEGRSSVLAAGPDFPGIPTGSVIAEVRVVAKDLFDTTNPEENRKLFRLANTLHRTTREGVIKSQLLFHPGDVFTPELIAESARILRTNDYLYDVDIKPILREDGQVDVEVTTRDVWTLEGGASFGRAGGRNSSSFSLTDTNFVGTGKEVTLARIGTIDRTSDLARYTDPNLFGSRVRLLLSDAKNSDGGRQRFEVERPFYSLDTRWAAGLITLRDDRLESLYSLGKVDTDFRHLTDSAEVYGGFSPGLIDGYTHRWQAGFTYSRDDFSPSLQRTPLFKSLITGPVLTDPVPPDRTLAYPWVRFESVQDRYVVEKDLDRIQRSEDLNLGRQYNVLLGLSSPRFGGDTQRWIGQAALSDGWRPAPGQIVLYQLGASTRWAKGDAENLVAGARPLVRPRLRRERLLRLARRRPRPPPGRRGPAPARRRQRPARLPDPLPGRRPPGPVHARAALLQRPRGLPPRPPRRRRLLRRRPGLVRRHPHPAGADAAAGPPAAEGPRLRPARRLQPLLARRRPPRRRRLPPRRRPHHPAHPVAGVDGGYVLEPRVRKDPTVPRVRPPFCLCARPFRVSALPFCGSALRF